LDWKKRLVIAAAMQQQTENDKILLYYARDRVSFLFGCGRV
jgi:hypothetical protein